MIGATHRSLPAIQTDFSAALNAPVEMTAERLALRQATLFQVPKYRNMARSQIVQFSAENLQPRFQIVTKHAVMIARIQSTSTGPL